MNYDYEIQNLKATVENLQQTIIQMARNNTPIVGKVDSTANAVETLTPYTETKTIYIGETNTIFENVPEGNLAVYLKDANGNYPNYTAERNNDKITITFEPMSSVATVTISIS